MASNFSSLRKSRTGLLQKLAEEAKKESQKGGGADEGFWKLTVDAKTKIGYARLRFLPAPVNEELPWVRVFSHAFQGPGGSWFFENCPTTLGRQCPVCQDNSKLWKSGSETDKEVARKRKRKLSFISNILVIEDSAKPDNNGKVFLYKYGAKIHEKLKEQIEPEFPDSVAMNPFDLWEGADFKLKSRDVAGYQNYDKSEFADPSELLGGDEAKLEALWQSQKSLAAFVDEKQFKSFEDLEKRLVAVLTGEARGPRTAEDAIKRANEGVADVAEEVAERVEKEERKPTRRPVKKEAAPVKEVETSPEDDDIADFFKGLNDED